MRRVPLAALGRTVIKVLRIVAVNYIIAYILQGMR
jgi:hypothetical protein